MDEQNEQIETEVIETEEVEESGQVEEEGEPTAPPEEDPKLKAAIAQARDEKRKRQDLERRMQLFESQQAAAVSPVAELVKPTPDQFNDYDAYVEALADYKATQIYRRESEKTRTLTQAEIAKREEAKLTSKANADAKKAAEKYEDFYDVAATVVLPDLTLKAMYQSDIGAEIAYHLGKNPAELDRLNDLSPARQIMELGKLEAKLAAKTANPDKKQVRKATEVESSGNGFQKPKTDLSKILERAKQTGDWTQYLEATGNL